MNPRVLAAHSVQPAIRAEGGAGEVPENHQWAHVDSNHGAPPYQAGSIACPSGPSGTHTVTGSHKNCGHLQRKSEPCFPRRPNEGNRGPGIWVAECLQNGRQMTPLRGPACIPRSCRSVSISPPSASRSTSTRTSHPTAGGGDGQDRRGAGCGAGWLTAVTVQTDRRRLSSPAMKFDAQMKGSRQVRVWLRPSMSLPNQQIGAESYHHKIQRRFATPVPRRCYRVRRCLRRGSFCRPTDADQREGPRMSDVLGIVRTSL